MRNVIIIIMLVSTIGCRLPQRFQSPSEAGTPPSTESVIPHVVPVDNPDVDLQSEPKPTGVRPTPTPIAAVEEVPEAVVPEAAPAPTDEGWDDIRVGMTQAEVEVRIGSANAEVSRGTSSVVYRWNNSEENATGLGKFEDGTLTLWRVRDKVKTPAQVTAPIAKAEEAVPVKQTPTATKNETEGMVAPRAAPRSEAVVAPSRPRVSVAGSSRRDRVAQQSTAKNQTGAYQPKARLPEFTYGLQDGSYIFRMLNDGGSTVQVGLHSGKDGKDISINQGEEISVRVQRGDFRFYYIFDASPYTRYETAQISLDGDTGIEQHIRLQESTYVLGGIAQQATATN